MRIEIGDYSRTEVQMKRSSLTRKLVGIICASVLVSPLGAAAVKKTDTTTSRGVSKKKAKKKKVAGWRRGQQKIDPQRTREIQAALIREHYMGGEPTGVWDQTSQHAMERYQSDNGWQSKSIPDSRALIKLGLGPDHEKLLNPESAMTTASQSHAASTASDPDPQK
jgi:peptidoglycan hydrolase-like protein with peptidoglycan-binding domain